MNFETINYFKTHTNNEIKGENYALIIKPLIYLFFTGPSPLTRTYKYAGMEIHIPLILSYIILFPYRTCPFS